MSSTPLIELEHATKRFVRKESYHTYEMFETAFQGWTAKAEIEWNTETGELSRYWIKIQNPKEKQGWRTGEVDGRSKTFGEKVERFEMRFSGFGAVSIEEATHHLDTLGITLATAKELQRRLDAGEIVAPKIGEFDKTINLLSK